MKMNILGKTGLKISAPGFGGLFFVREDPGGQKAMPAGKRSRKKPAACLTGQQEA